VHADALDMRGAIAWTRHLSEYGTVVMGPLPLLTIGCATRTKPALCERSASLRAG